MNNLFSATNYANNTFLVREVKKTQVKTFKPRFCDKCFRINKTIIFLFYNMTSPGLNEKSNERISLSVPELCVDPRRTSPDVWPCPDN